MPKSKRSKTVHLTQVDKKTREHKEKLFNSIRAAVPEYQHCFVLDFSNMRNTYLQDLRRAMGDSRYALLPSLRFPSSSCALLLALRAGNTRRSKRESVKGDISNLSSPTASSSARQNSWPRPWARPKTKPKPTASMP